MQSLVPREIDKCLSKHRPNLFKRLIRKMRFGNNPKVFCIGANKTGTTSLAHALKELGYKLGGQHEAELIAVRDWKSRNFSALVKYCRTAEAFQDIPFSCPYTFQILDAFFPDSKFILTIRDSSDTWYNSMLRFHSKVFGNDNVPTSGQLKEAFYLFKGWPFEVNQMLYDNPADDPYLKKGLVQYYENHNRNVKDYFRFRENDLLILNVAESGAYSKLCNFLQRTAMRQDFPHLNKT